MAFVNKYNNVSNFWTPITRKIGEYIYTLSSDEQSNAFLMKTDISGAILWEKKIVFTDLVRVNKFRNIADAGNGRIIIGCYGYSKVCSLVCINSEGAILWSKTYEVSHGVRGGDLESLNNTETVVLMRGSPLGTDTVFKIDTQGNVITQKTFTSPTDQTNFTDDRGVAVENSIVYINTAGGFLKLDANLNLKNALRIPLVPMLLYTFTCKDEELIITLSFYEGSKMYMARIPFSDSQGDTVVDRISFDTTGNIYSFKKFGSEFYVTLRYSYTKFFRLDSNFNFLQGVNIGGNPYTIQDITSDNILLSYISGSSNELGIALLGQQMQSCISLPDDNAPLITRTPLQVKLNLSVKVQESKIVVGQPVLRLLSTNTAIREITCEFENITLSESTLLQSSHFYLQAAGSVGADSTKGIHLRWALREGLAAHLPKGNYATNNYNFNKSDDFVKVYRAKYTPKKVILDFNKAPVQVNESNDQKNWLYSVNDKIFHIHFRDTVKYNQVRTSNNPANTSLDFIAAYGDSLLEIETKSDLSFKVSPVFKITNGANSAQVEVLSVAANKITAPKAASLRKKYSLTEINQNGVVAENIRSIRFRSVNGHIQTVAFEFYADFISGINSDGNWDVLGEYALTKDDAVAFRRLEPQSNALKTWLRYNDQAFVNPSNYRSRWNGNALPPLERIATSVERYIALSDSYDNTAAVAYFPFDDQTAVATCAATNPDYDPYVPENLDGANGIPISYLDVLLLGSTDYHNARMIGLGTLDLDEEVFSGEYIYVAEYVTFGDLQDGLGAREVRHLYCSLPTSLSDSRLPIAVDLKQPVPGLFFDNGYDDSEVEEEVQDPEQIDYSSVQLTEDGYTPDGKTRYYSFYAESVFDEDYNAPFYYVDIEFKAAESTYPVFAGIEYRKTGDTGWIKPELSYNPQFYNIDSSGIDIARRNETVEIVIPDAGKPLYSHAVKESGKFDYSSYGINWFSRANRSSFIYTVETVLKLANELLPPTSIMATLIQKERPLLLSTAAEQGRFEANPNTDKTLVRLTFEYNHAQELIDYHHKINGEVVDKYFETPNYKEPFADKIQVFFRDRVPASVYGKVKAVTPIGNPLTVQITTEPYIVISQGINENTVPQTTPPTYNEVYTPSIPPGSENNFIGSIFLVDGVEYVIQEVNNSGAYPTFIVLKADASNAMLNLSSGGGSNQNLIIPEEGSLFTIVENIQNLSSWNLPSNPGFTVNIDLNEVHREDEIVIENTDCSTETHVQKFRGIYKNAVITKIFEKVDLNDNGYFDISSGTEEDPNNTNYLLKHRGNYRITFHGFHLPQHSQYTISNNSHTNSVEWYNGIVRLHTLSDLGATPRKEFKVIRAENIGTSNDLVLYIQDLTFPSSEASLGYYESKIIPDGAESITQVVNYYPGYKLYLYKDISLGLNADTVLPLGEDDVRYTIFGLRSKDFKNEFENDNTVDFFSKMSIPALMFANAIREPMVPQKPTGGMYATRPDYFGKSSYTFTTKYGSENEGHKPYSVQFNRASDIQFLSAIYDTTVQDNDLQNNPVLNTLQIVLKNIFMEGEEDFYVDRWNNLLSFNYTYPGSPENNGNFLEFEGRRLPRPDNINFITSVNTFIEEHNRFYNLTGADAVPNLDPDFNLNTLVIPEIENVSDNIFVKDFLKDIMMNCFTPLTEIPIVYNYVKGNDYVPIPKKQVVRDRNGNLLNPTDSNFDMAPMMKRIDPAGAPHESQFTDFGLDGASNAKYFYAAREMNNQLKTSGYSDILGPISLVNTAPPVAPQIIKVVPVLENRVLDIAPAIQLQINSYPKPQHIAKASIYRSTDPVNALSVRTMDLIRVLDLEEEGILENNQWVLNDSFDDLGEIPFSDPLFYRITVSRRIRYNDSELNLLVDYAPSEASPLIITNIVENYAPPSPILDYYSEPINEDNELVSVILHWEKTCYKCKYHVYKMNSQGNWMKIHELQTNDQDIYLALVDTDLESGTLTVVNDQGDPVYHHFKVIAENTAGMQSREENILTIYIQDNWRDIGGIGEMIVGNTFVIR
jgi:hypothetical protein